MEQWNNRNTSKENMFLTFLNKLREVGILDQIRKRQIIIADDQFVNLKAFDMSLESIDPAFNEYLKMFANG